MLKIAIAKNYNNIIYNFIRISHRYTEWQLRFCLNIIIHHLNYYFYHYLNASVVQSLYPILCSKMCIAADTLNINILKLL